MILLLSLRSRFCSPALKAIFFKKKSLYILFLKFGGRGCLLIFARDSNLFLIHSHLLNGKVNRPPWNHRKSSREIQLTLKPVSICAGARWRRRSLGPDHRSKGALLFHCRDDIGRWEWENAVCTATVWRKGDRRGCHGRAWRHYCNKAKIIRTHIEDVYGKQEGKRGKKRCIVGPCLLWEG